MAEAKKCDVCGGFYEGNCYLIETDLKVQDPCYTKDCTVSLQAEVYFKDYRDKKDLCPGCLQRLLSRAAEML